MFMGEMVMVSLGWMQSQGGEESFGEEDNISKRFDHLTIPFRFYNKIGRGFLFVGWKTSWAKGISWVG